MTSPKQAVTTHAQLEAGRSARLWRKYNSFLGKLQLFAGKPLWPDGGAEGARTPDLLNAIQALYQLSYDPSQSGGQFIVLMGIVKVNLFHFELSRPNLSICK